MLPRVVLHNAVSLDGRIEGFPLDLQQYYELAATWKEDATLAGSQTFLKAADEAPPEDERAFLPPGADPDDRRPLLVIPDSRGQIRTWHYLRSLPYWRGFVVLCSLATPMEYLHYLEERHIDWVITGEEHVDLRAALEEISSRYGVKVVRVDAGGTLNGLLLRQGLVDEVSLLIYPCLIGGEGQSSIFRAADLPASPAWQVPEGVISLHLIDAQRLRGDVMWLRYGIRR
jgi:2,5-diamino-6-(ribosylamino)-4(3H)-pyrimidinone 5'-phosphate reductase